MTVLTLPERVYGASSSRVSMFSSLQDALRDARQYGFLPTAIQQVQDTGDYAEILLKMDDMEASIISQGRYRLALPNHALEHPIDQPSSLEKTLADAVGDGYTPRAIVQSYLRGSDGHIELSKEGRVSAMIIYLNGSPLIVDSFTIFHVNNVIAAYNHLKDKK